MLPSFNMTLVYFDRHIIRKKWGAINKDPLERASNMVMRTARWSIRNQATRHKGVRERKPSKPGHAPYSWKPGNLPPFKQIFSDWYGLLQTGRIVGMVGYGEQPPIPGLHEHGGYAVRNVRILTPRRTASGRFTSPGMKRKIMTVKYPKRPFMEPALRKVQDLFPALWKNSLTRSAA